MAETKRPLEEIESEIAELSARIDEATYKLLVAIREFDERGGWADQGARSCAHWLNWRVGLDLGAAREKVRVANALPQFPSIAEALRRGQVSYSKVRAITRVATPETEAFLLDIARTGTATHVEKLVRGYRRMTREEAKRQQQNRTLRTWWARDGMLVVEGRLSPEAGAVFLKALEAAGEAIYQKERREEPGGAAPSPTPAPAPVPAQEPMPQAVATPPAAPSSEAAPVKQSDPDFWYGIPFGEGAPRDGRWQKQADALALISESALGEGLRGTSSAADRYQVVLHVDAEALRDPAASGRSHLEDGPDISAETILRISCDTGLVRIVEGPGGEPLDVGRKTRTIPPAIRRALNARDKGCRWPSCDSRRFLQAHHVHHWAKGGETSLGNTLLLCRAHHTLVHERGYAIDSLPGGEIVFRDARGRTIPSTGALPPATGDPLGALATRLADPDLLPASPFPTWLGEPMNTSAAVGWLLDKRRM